MTSITYCKLIAIPDTSGSFGSCRITQDTDANENRDDNTPMSGADAYKHLLQCKKMFRNELMYVLTFTIIRCNGDDIYDSEKRDITLVNSSMDELLKAFKQEIEMEIVKEY